MQVQTGLAVNMSVWNPSGSNNVHIDQVLPNVGIGWSNMPYEIRTVNGRQCVFKKGTNESLGCHDTRSGAYEQMQALYVKEGGKMGESSSYLVNMDAVQLNEGNASWIHALPLGTYKHPIYGTLDINVERVKRFAESVKKRVRGVEPSINYNHSGGEEAAGWVKDADSRSDGLWLFVEWVAEAATKIKEKKFRYFSAEFANSWEDPQGKSFVDVIVGGALTNRPFMKNLVPLNLSESVVENAFDLVEAITGKTDLKKDETHMNEADLQKIIDGVAAKLAPQPPKIDPPKNNIAKLEEIEELRKLAEANPMVKTLLTHFEHQASSIADSNKRMRETIVDAKLAEFDNSKLTLTPSAKELAREIMLGIPDELTNKFWEFMENVRTSQSFLVELGTRSGASIRPGISSNDKTATQMFNDRMNELMTGAEKLDFLSAAERVAAEDPKLYEAYRLGDGAPASL